MLEKKVGPEEIEISENLRDFDELYFETGRCDEADLEVRIKSWQKN